MVNHFAQVKLASKLPAGQTYAVFRKGVTPDWEDAANKDGGRWLLHYEKRERAIRLDDRWMEVLVLALGNHLNSAVTGTYHCIVKIILLDRGSIRSSPSNGLSTPYRLTIRNSARHHVLFNYRGSTW